MNKGGESEISLFLVMELKRKFLRKFIYPFEIK